MEKLLVSKDINDSLCSMLHRIGLTVLPLQADPRLPLPVASHADMLIFSDGARHVVTATYYEENREVLKDIGLTVTYEEYSSVYPCDILLNAFVYRGRLYGRLDSISDMVKSFYPKRRNLRQGYAKCSTLLFGDRAVTSDRGIADALGEQGCDTLLISSGHILLPGYDYGFIGGASCVYRDTVIFFGDLSQHPDYEKIKAFIEGGGYKLVCDKATVLTDLGGGIII